MAQIAAGLADASFTLRPKSEWDICAGHNLIEEAGGFVCALDGKAVPYNQKNPLLEGLIYGNSEVYKEPLLSLIPKRP
jgi:myo-inositol-1(or 4)-monophosphatase